MDADKTLLLDYAALKAVVADATAKMEAMQPEVLEVVSRLNPTDRTVAVEGTGTFMVGVRKSYTYSPETQAIDEALKRRKKDEVRTGEAAAEEKEFLVFRPEGSEYRGEE